MRSRFVLLLIVLYLCPNVFRAQVLSSRDQTIRDFMAMGIPFYGANKVEILPTGIIKFNNLFPAIDRAEHFIHMDYFKFQQDSICGVFFDHLRAKARQGVEVRVVYDDVGNRNSPLPLRKSYMDSLRADGVQLYEFDRFKFPYINHMLHRDHHKIAIIDGRMVYTGGMNVADYYLHGKPEVGEWRDMHMRVDGPLVAGYEEIFEAMWLKVTGERLGPEYKEVCGTFDRGQSLVALCDRVPRKTASIMRDTYITCIDNAQSLIQIVNPYITLTIGIRKALNRALRRGVRLQIMLSTKNDGPVVPDVAGIEMRKLQKRGAEIYYYEGGFHHSKVMMIDSTFCTIGTTNLDGRSLKYDYEVNSFIFDEEPTRELQRIFQKDVDERCTLLT
ncbi:MAG: phosphatidylserine/phosphatidylglycerophosphate/cardiolipin synthase family protein, partial [Bacteroidaceae bacterium]|nr:phosphatidylserine/phosphatidylglycerophosphate/cardiolipin synthase family protein [Bacteroidaceae bacterium]